MKTKAFPTRVLLTVTTGRLLTAPQCPRDNGISDLYDLLGWMTADSPFTHQLPRFSTECKSWLLRWFPELAAVDDLKLAALDRAIKQHGNDGVESWLKYVDQSCQLLGIYDVPRIPRDDHDRKDPYDELVAMRGTDEGIIVVKTPEGTP